MLAWLKFIAAFDQVTGAATNQLQFGPNQLISFQIVWSVVFQKSQSDDASDDSSILRESDATVHHLVI